MRNGRNENKQMISEHRLSLGVLNCILEEGFSVKLNEISFVSLVITCINTLPILWLFELYVLFVFEL